MTGYYSNDDYDKIVKDICDYYNKIVSLIRNSRTKIIWSIFKDTFWFIPNQTIKPTRAVLHQSL